MSEQRLFFPPESRLKKRWEFDNAYRMGCKINTPHFLILRSDNFLLSSRLGLTVSRKVGNAVTRNRLKRIIREYFRKYQFRIQKPMDLSVIVKRGAGNVSTRDLWHELEMLFK